MPHDRDGKLLAIGDLINIPAVVLSLQLGDDYCNVTVETTERMPPDNNYTNTYTLNTKQVVKVANA